MYAIRLLSLLAALAFVPAIHAADLEVSDAWVRGTVPAQKSTGAFMQLRSRNGAAVVGASSPLAAIVEIHEMTMEGSMMHMRAIQRLEVPAGRPVALQPGSYHIMLLDLKQPLTPGMTVPLQLKVEARGKTETIDVKAEVRALTADGMPQPHQHGQMK